MGLFNDYQNDSDVVDVKLEDTDVDELVRLFAYDEIAHLSDDDRKAFCENTEAVNVLTEKGMINKTDLMRLSKTSDLDRRTSLTSMLLARKAGDALWKKYAKILQMKKDLKAAINRKYSSRSKMGALKSQKAYIKSVGGISNYILR